MFTSIRRVVSYPIGNSRYLAAFLVYSIEGDSILKRKPTQPVEPVISRDLLEQAKKSIQVDTLKREAKCTVCGGECAPNTNAPQEQLCWVCRRLKISAWRDSDQQMPAQE
jgi:hypothetical protein